LLKTKKSKSYDLSHDFGAAFKRRPLDAAVYEASCAAEDLEHLLALLPIHCSIAHHGRAEGDRAAVADAPLEDVDKSPARKRRPHPTDDDREAFEERPMPPATSRKRPRSEEELARLAEEREKHGVADFEITALHKLFDFCAGHTRLIEIFKAWNSSLSPTKDGVADWERTQPRPLQDLLTELRAKQLKWLRARFFRNVVSFNIGNAQRFRLDELVEATRTDMKTRCGPLQSLLRAILSRGEAFVDIEDNGAVRRAVAPVWDLWTDGRSPAVFETTGLARWDEPLQLL